MLVMEAFGAGLVVEPYLPTIVLCGTVLRLAATPAQKASLLPGLIAGETLIALAHAERGTQRHTITEIRATATPSVDGWLLNGEKSAVLNGDTANTLIVSARTGHTVTLFLVPAESPGVSVRAHPTYDGRRMADVTLESVRAPNDARLGPTGAGAAILQFAVETVTAALAAVT